MSNIPSSEAYIQIEGAQERSAVSESLIQTIGGAVNYLNDQDAVHTAEEANLQSQINASNALHNVAQINVNINPATFGVGTHTLYTASGNIHSAFIGSSWSFTPPNGFDPATLVTPIVVNAFTGQTFPSMTSIKNTGSFLTQLYSNAYFQIVGPNLNLVVLSGTIVNGAGGGACVYYNV